MSEAVKCEQCGRERRAGDMDYNPMQAIFGAELGWYSGDDGEFCGACLGELMGRANS